MKTILKLLPAAFLLFLFSCNNTEEKKESDHHQIVDQQLTLEQKYGANKGINEMAHFIAGMPLDSGSGELNSLIYDSAYSEFKKNFNKGWVKFDTTRIKPIAPWRATELQNTSDSKTLFYPFSGPDFLYANAFFPDAENIVMIGLEPVGSMPDAKDFKKEELRNYFSTVSTSLFAIFNYSFFRTLAMKNDLTNHAVDGTFQIIALFMARNNFSLLQSRYITVDTSGNIITHNSKDSLQKNKGIEITYCKTGSRLLRHLYYWQANLGNEAYYDKDTKKHFDSLKKNRAFMNYLNALPACNTYIKSASYLLHYGAFSMMRELLLKKSVVLLQDDSGIPYHFFEKDKWNITLYGSYHKPGKPFEEMSAEADLMKAYHDTNPKPLPFGIGYSIFKSTSNLLLAKRK